MAAISKVEKVVKIAWNKHVDGSRGYRITKKVKEYRAALIRWNKKLKVYSKKEINRLKNEIEQLKGLDRQGNHSKIAKKKGKLAFAYKNEEKY